MENAKKTLKEDLFGVFYVKKPNGVKWESYYKSMKALRPLFSNEDFKEIVSGFYLNVCGDFDSVRISYFVERINENETIGIFRKFFNDNGLIEIKNSQNPKEIILALNYGGKELEEEFRNFLVLETKIGLELLEKDLLTSRILFAMYIFRVRNNNLQSREYIEPIFSRYSLTYRCLPENEKSRFFHDFDIWNHLMVNFVLGADCSIPKGSLSISEINKYIGQMGFQIPLDWKPS